MKPIDAMKDPFRNQKEEALTNLSLILVNSILKRQNQFVLEDKELNLCNLEKLVLSCLSGNQADLSMWPGMKVDENQTLNKNGLVVNHLQNVLTYFESLTKYDKEIKIIYFFDNSGLELFCDLCLIDYLLSKLPKLQISAYLKPVPAFVSDATTWDLSFSLQYLSQINEIFTKRITSYIQTKQLEIKTSFFSICPLPLWDAPYELQKEITTANISIFKGDLNYRKILGDRHWNYDKNFKEVVAYVNAKIVTLRTCKSMVAVGVNKEFVARMEKEEPEWLSSGKYEFIQANF